ncbi:diguanylate cyclase [Rhodoferax sp.]|uniref:GGDEF domain-containing response regulator n=1 Tax=Rhodoferax sp. TaxID=50421 RepID=UPI002601934D|nr:diguanylate cyclase [Rhodoferax sp.]MDD2924925.1 diguanylate cyclase [Rhodoferax sp.]
MPCSPAELQKKSDEFLSRWQSCKDHPGVDAFVEFAVAASSFTEFLDARGLPGLHQNARAVEQQVLSQFDRWNTDPMPEAPIGDLDRQIAEFGVRIAAFLNDNTDASPGRRLYQDDTILTEFLPAKKIWLLTSNPDDWKDVITQAGYFNIQVEVCRQHKDQKTSPDPTIVLVDAKALEPAAFNARVQALRSRFLASSIIGLQLPPDFEGLHLALRHGCDLCFPRGTAQSAIMARLVKLCGGEQEPPYRVLVVEDSKTASTVIQRTLKESGVESMAISRPQEVLTALSKFQPDLVLMDMYMPGCTGVEVTRVIRQHEEFLSTPVVYLSADTSIALQVDALRLGGDHFLTKPFNPVILNAVVRSKIERYRILRRSMYLDSLTGLLNHTTSKQRLGAAVSTALAEGSPLCVAMIDIDHFKKVNDTHGHPMGDQVIRSLAWLLKQRLRKTDAVGRYGGEEFLVILPLAHADRAHRLLDRIRIDFSQFSYPVPGAAFACSFSGGIAQLKPGMNAPALVKLADDALYQAKRQGRNQLVACS